MTDKTPAMTELPEGATLEDFLIPLRHAQQAPEWDGGKPANLQAAARDADEWLALIQRLNDAGRLRFSQPDSRSKLDGCRAALSKILCAPAQQAVPMTDELEQEDFALFSQTQVAALLWVLWCHQGASSAIGQPIRFALGMGKRQALTDEQVSAAQRFRIDWHQWCGITQRADGGEQQA